MVQWSGCDEGYEPRPLREWVERWKDWGLFAWRRLMVVIASIQERIGVRR